MHPTHKIVDGECDRCGMSKTDPFIMTWCADRMPLIKRQERDQAMKTNGVKVTETEAPDDFKAVAKKIFDHIESLPDLSEAKVIVKSKEREIDEGMSEIFGK